MATTTVIGALFILNLPLALSIIKLLQFFEFFNLLNLDYPANLIVFFKLFKGGIFKFLPNIFIEMSSKSDYVETCEPFGRMGEEEMSCSFLLNGGDFLTVILMLILIKGIIVIIQAILRLKHKQGCGKKVKDTEN